MEMKINETRKSTTIIMYSWLGSSSYPTRLAGSQESPMSLFTNHPPRSTHIQRHMIDRLTIELGMKTMQERNAKVAKEVGREVAHLVELTHQEAQAVIEVLKVEVGTRKDRKDQGTM